MSDSLFFSAVGGGVSGVLSDARGLAELRPPAGLENGVALCGREFPLALVGLFTGDPIAPFTSYETLNLLY